ncbi:DNA methyltransferase [Streptomyces formicae]
MSALRRPDRRLGACSNCGGSLTELDLPGLVVDPFAGSGSTLDAARQAGRRVIGIEAHEPYAEAAARRLTAQVFT